MKPVWRVKKDSNPHQSLPDLQQVNMIRYLVLLSLLGSVINIVTHQVLITVSSVSPWWLVCHVSVAPHHARHLRWALIGWHIIILTSDWLTHKNTDFWLVETQKYWLLIGWHKKILNSDWSILSAAAQDTTLWMSVVVVSLVQRLRMRWALIGWHRIILISDWLTQECGGPFRISGQCATGTRCLRQCGGLK